MGTGDSVVIQKQEDLGVSIADTVCQLMRQLNSPKQHHLLTKEIKENVYVYVPAIVPGPSEYGVIQ